MAFSLPSGSQAAPFLYEGFDYPAGASSLAGKNGGLGWSGAWELVNNGTDDLVAGSLVGGASVPTGYDSLSSGNKTLLQNGRRTGRNIDTTLTGPFGTRGYRDAGGRIGADGKTIYISFLQQPNGTTLYYEFEFHRDNLSDPGRIGGIGNDQAGSNVNLRAPNGTHTMIGAGTTAVNFYVVRIDFKAGNDDVRVYRNPTSTTEPGSPTLTKLAAADMSFNGISFGAFVNGRTVAHDEVRMGETWADVTSEPITPVFPNITRQPFSFTTYAGTTATFSVEANGFPTPTVQWFKGATAISGATSQTLAIPNVQLADIADYSCTVTNSQGSVTSSPAHLHVVPQPAGLLAYEGFDYPVGNGQLAGKLGGTGWNGAWTIVGGGGHPVLAGNLEAGLNGPNSYDGQSLGNQIETLTNTRNGRFLDTSIGGAFGTKGYRDASGNIGADGKVIYVSFVQQPNATTTYYEFEFHKANLGDPGRIAGIGNDTTGDNVNLRAPGGVHTMIAPGSLQPSFYVVRIDFKTGNDDVRVYRNPTSLSEPATPTLTKLAAADMSFNGISFGAYLASTMVKHDEVRVGETWAAVVPTATVDSPLVSSPTVTTQTATTTTLDGTIQRAGIDTPNVTIFYGLTDGGTNASSWTQSAAFGPQTAGFTAVLTSLQPYTRYFYRAYVQNSAGGNWSPVTLDFATPVAGPVISNLAATELTIATAKVGASVTSSGGRAPLITLYYGTSDGGTNPAAWTQHVDLGTVSTSSTITLGGLNAATTYYFRAFAANEGGSSWAASSGSFTTPVASLPTIENVAASQINGFSANLNGQVTSTGQAPTTVTIFYGMTDGGTNAAAWASSAEMGLQSGSYTQLIATLTPTTGYFFRSRATNAAGETWAAVSTAFTTPGFTAATVYLNEFVASTDNDDPHVYSDDAGNAEDWIELHNPDASAADIGGYYLTDNAANLRKWRFPTPTLIPANGYLVVFASNNNRAVSGQTLHTNFKLSDAGEYLGLVQPDGTTIVKAFAPTFPVVPEYWSYGLTLPSAGGAYAPFQLATPGAANTTTAGAPAGDVVFSIPSQTFSGASVSLQLTTASPTASIRYTTDRSEPTASSTLYAAAISLTTTTMIRARAFESAAGFAPGFVHSETYIKLGTAAATFSSNLPVVLVDNFSGGRPDADKGMFWTMFTPDAATGNRTAFSNAPVIATRGRMVVRGSSSAGWPKYSMNIEAWDEFNEDTPVSVLGMPAEADWILQSNYDADRGMIRNPFMSDMSNQMGRWAPHYRFVEVFANTNDGTVDYPGDYLGVYAIMEKPERGGDRIPVERLTSFDTTEPKISGGYIIKVDRPEAGTAGWVTSRNFPLSEPFGSIARLVYDYPAENPAPLASIPAAQSAYIRNYVQEFEDAIVTPGRIHPTTGKHYTDYIDRPSWVDHGLLNILSANVDGLRLSSFMYKPRNGKLFAGPIWDFDRTMASTDGRSTNPLGWSAFGNGGDATNLLTWGWWKYLYTDPDYWQLFTDRWAELRATTLATTAMHSQIDGYAAQITEAAVRNYAKWTATPPRDGPDANTTGSFIDEMDILKTWLSQHTAWIDGQFTPAPVRSPAGGVASSVILTASTGTIYYTTDGSDPRLSGGAVSPLATSLASGASVSITTGTTLTARTRNGALWSAPSTALYYVTQPAMPGTVAITELHYHPADPTPTEQAAGFTNSDVFEFLKVTNTSATDIDLAGCTFTDGIDYTFPANAVLAAGQSTLIVASRNAFAVRYPTVPASAIIGEYLGDRLENAGELVRLVSASGAELLAFTYGTTGLWPLDADGAGKSLVYVAGDASTPYAWRPSLQNGGNPVGSDSIDYTAWKTTYSITSDTADTDADGLSSLVEYASGGNPAAADVSLLPTYTKDTNGDYVITIRRAWGADDVGYTVQTGATLADFADVALTAETRTFASGYEVLTGRLSLPEGANRHFLRVKWTLR
jgi:hypothetical protein